MKYLLSFEQLKYIVINEQDSINKSILEKINNSVTRYMIEKINNELKNISNSNQLDGFLYESRGLSFKEWIDSLPTA